MKNIIATIGLATIIAGCSTVDNLVHTHIDPPMSAEERKEFNSAPWSKECVFDEEGNALNPDEGWGMLGCSDSRWINKSTKGNFYLTPATPNSDIMGSIVIPDDVLLVEYDSVSAVESVCYQIQIEVYQWKKARGIPAEYPVEYVPGCYYESEHVGMKMVLIVHGDYEVLEHELRHYSEGDFHE